MTTKTNDTKMAETLKKKYPNRIPIVVKAKSPLTIKKTKFLVPNELIISQFMKVLRKYVTITEHHALFIFINDVMPNPNYTLAQLYKEHFESEGFFKIVVAKENTFG